MKQKNLKFGIDAPVVIRNLSVGALIAGALVVLSFQITAPLWFWIALLYSGATFLSLSAASLWMLYCTWHIKPRLLKRLVEGLCLQGGETVLDVGCGRGQLLVEVASRVPDGRVVGIDLWRSEDQSGNSQQQAEANLRAAAVDGWTCVETADMRSLPFPDATFDVVVSSLAIHNVSDAAGRRAAILECLRILKPGGRLALLDIRYGKEYAEVIHQSGDTEVSCQRLPDGYIPPIWMVTGSKRRPLYS